ncbi:hypothetical protein NDA13_000026 [Ustilago tritici]|nr:hypothetical protein NDA13_000026 [Ustilago tritici]
MRPHIAKDYKKYCCECGERMWNGEFEQDHEPNCKHCNGVRRIEMEDAVKNFIISHTRDKDSPQQPCSLAAFTAVMSVLQLVKPKTEDAATAEAQPE